MLKERIHTALTITAAMTTSTDNGPALEAAAIALAEPSANITGVFSVEWTYFACKPTGLVATENAARTLHALAEQLPWPHPWNRCTYGMPNCLQGAALPGMDFG